MHDKLQDLRSRGHSYRNFEPGEVLDILDYADENEDYDLQADVRDFLRFMEDGRFRAMLDEAHNMIARLDPDEVADFRESNPDLARWVNVFARAEDLRPFERGDV